MRVSSGYGAIFLLALQIAESEKKARSYRLEAIINRANGLEDKAKEFEEKSDRQDKDITVALLEIKHIVEKMGEPKE